MKSLFTPVVPLPILSAESLREIAHEALAASSADVTSVLVHHIATGVTRVTDNHVRVSDSGDTLTIELEVRFGDRESCRVVFNQADLGGIRAAVRYAEGVARESGGDPGLTPQAMPILPRSFLNSTVWHDETAAAMTEARQEIVPALLHPMIADNLQAAAFVGVYAHAKMYADKQGLFSTDQETDAEIAVTGRTRNDVGILASPGWAGQAAREWKTLDAAAVGAEAARITKLAANAVAYEPGRRLTILDRPAVAQMLRAVGRDFDAFATHRGMTPLSGFKIGQKVWDERIDLSSDPNDPDGGYLTCDDQGFPLSPMSWLSGGKLDNLAYNAYYAAQMGVAQSNDAPESLRMQAVKGGKTLTVDEMITGAKEAIYVNRLTDIQVINGRTGLMTGYTQGGCFLVHNGKIEKPVKDFRFVESMYFILNRLVAMGTPKRTAFGYAPWHGAWPIAPTIVPPVMISDFNFVALAEAV